MARYVTQFELAADIDNPSFVDTLARALREIRAEHNVDVSARLDNNRLLLTVWVEVEALGARNASDSAWNAVRQASVDAEAATAGTRALEFGPPALDYMPGWLTLGKVDVRHVVRPNEEPELDRAAAGHGDISANN